MASIQDNCHLQMLSFTPEEESDIKDLFKKVTVDHALNVQSMKYQASLTSKGNNYMHLSTNM